MSGKTFIAVRKSTSVWLFSCMYSEVSLEISFLCKTFMAIFIRAQKRLISSLLNLLTSKAYMSSGVNRQSSDARIFLSAVVAHVRLFTCVR